MSVSTATGRRTRARVAVIRGRRWAAKVWVSTTGAEFAGGTAPAGASDQAELKRAFVPPAQVSQGHGRDTAAGDQAAELRRQQPGGVGLEEQGGGDPPFAAAKRRSSVLDQVIKRAGSSADRAS